MGIANYVINMPDFESLLNQNNKNISGIQKVRLCAKVLIIFADIIIKVKKKVDIYG